MEAAPSTVRHRPVCPPSPPFRATQVPAQVLNDCMAIVREGGRIGIPGLYVTEDPGGAYDYSLC